MSNSLAATAEVHRQDTDELNAIFIHSKLDEARISPYAFRLYCHLARRGTCYSSAATIADVCCMDRKTVFAAIKELKDRNMIASTSRQGGTTLITITKPSTWTPVPKTEQGRPVNGTPTRSTNGTPPVPFTEHKGNPLKVIPLKEDMFDSCEDAFATSTATGPYHPHARVIIHFLNEQAGRNFRETDPHLRVISARLRERGITLDGVKEMILRQIQLWSKDPKMAQYLTVDTLFRPAKFGTYYDMRKEPVFVAPTQTQSNGRPKTDLEILQEACG